MYIGGTTLFGEVRNNKEESVMEEIKVNMENLTEEERKQLLALIEKSNESKSKVWKPKEEEVFYSIYGNGNIMPLTFNKSDASDRKRIALGNYFYTREEAEFMLERLKVLQELRELANGYKFAYMENNYFIAYSHASKKICINYYNEVKRNDIYFETEKEAKAAIKTIGEERLKKYYFCV